MSTGGHARRLATGALAQQAAQVTGLVVMFGIITVLARELTLAELGVYGLLTSLAGYLLIVQNAGASGAVRAIAAEADRDRRLSLFSTTAVLYAAAGLLAGLVVAGVGVALSYGLDLPSSVGRQARFGSLLLGAVTAIGWPTTVYRDALRADQRYVPAALTEIGALAVYAALVLGLALGGAPLATVIGASGSIPLLAGLGCAAVATAMRLGWRLDRGLVRPAAAREIVAVAGYVSLTEVAAAAIYTIDRAILGLFRSSTAVGLFEGPVRAHNLVRSLNAATMVTALPAASAYVAAGDDRRLRELVLRGCRYTLALAVPIAVTGMVLSGPLLDVWLGDEFRAGDLAMTILLAHWLVNACSGVLAAVMVAARRAVDLARYAGLVAGSNVVLALALVPADGVEGAALATSVPYLLLFPYLARRALRLAGVEWGVLARRAFVPAWTVGAGLAGALAAARAALSLDSAGEVAAVAAAGLLAGWGAFYLLWLEPSERRLVLGLLLRPVAGRR